MKPEWRFLCNACAFGGKYEIGRITKAWDPAFPPGRQNILACPRLHEVAPGKLLHTKKTKCDDCGITIYYAPSSDWIVQYAERP